MDVNDRSSPIPRVHSCAGLLLRLCAFAMAGPMLLLDLIGDPGAWVNILVAAAGALSVLTVFWLKPLRVWAVVTIGCSAAVTAVLAAAGPDAGVRSLTESFWLPVLFGLVVREIRRRRVVWYALPVAAAALFLPFRDGLQRSDAFMFVLLVGWTAVCFAAGVYLRGVDLERRRRTEDVKRAERVELARDLHDFVAHHITGIIVQAQAARFVAENGEPDRAAYERVFGQIEHSGAEALESMRRLVGVLRADDGATAPHADGLAEVERIVGDYGRVGPPTRLDIAPELRTDPPPYAVASTVARVVTEALTNVRKHAAGATRIAVRLDAMDGAIRVEILDDGAPGGRWRTRGPSGGYGLTGMRERVTALGGSLSAGRRPEGGWRVAAVVPVEPRTGESAS